MLNIDRKQGSAAQYCWYNYCKAQLRPTKYEFILDCGKVSFDDAKWKMWFYIDVMV